MIENEYILELELDLNNELLIELALTSTNVPELKKHQRFTKDYPYLEELRNRYSILGQLWNVYHFKPFTGIDTHVDTGRFCTLNIPLKGSENSLTKFYKSETSMKQVYHDPGVLNYIKTPLTSVFEFTLLRPTLIRTDVPHSVLAGKENRLIISWGIHELDFYQAKNFFKSMSVL